VVGQDSGVVCVVFEGYFIPRKRSIGHGIGIVSGPRVSAKPTGRPMEMRRRRRRTRGTRMTGMMVRWMRPRWRYKPDPSGFGCLNGWPRINEHDISSDVNDGEALV